MKIVVNIDHPADYHLFKNFISEMKGKGHEIKVIATNKEISLELLDHSGIEYTDLGATGRGALKKLLYLPLVDLKMYGSVKRFNPDIFVGFGSIRSSHVSFLLGKKCINFEDTESSMEQILLYLPFIDSVYTPSCFKRDLGRKQVRFDGYKELAYLHPNHFKPDPGVLAEIGLTENDAFFVLRFVSWGASHDIGQHGVQDKMAFVNALEKYGRVFITAEAGLEEGLEKYRIDIPPEKMHDLLYYASLYIGEGATMAAEAAVLGTPSIYISSILERLGYIAELHKKYGMLFVYDDEAKALEKAIELIGLVNVKEKWRAKRDEMLKEKIDVTAFMVWLVENYPASLKAMREKPAAQHAYREA